MIRLLVHVCGVVALIAPNDTTLADAEPLRLSPGPHLFIDDYLIETCDLTRVTHAPEKLPSPILAKSESWHLQPLFFLKVIEDRQGRLLRMWYNVKNPGRTPHVCFAYAESRDGVEWARPDLGLVSVGGSKNNNLIQAPGGHFGLFFIDDGPDLADPSRRYKMAYFGNGLCVAFSPDGLHFEPHQNNPVIPFAVNEIPPYEPGYVNVISDIVDGCWDPLRGRYLLGCKIEQGGYPGKPKHHAAGWRRTVGMSVSHDFLSWSRPWQIVKPDPENGIEEFYGFQPMVRGNLYLGFLRVLRDDLSADDGGPVQGIGWTELMTSRDGEKWTRYQDKFLDRNLQPGTWDHAMAWVGDCVTVGDQEYVYYGGYAAGHKVGDRQVGLAKLRKNGFVSRDAGAEVGFLRTRLVVLHGRSMTVNANVRGEMRFRVLDSTNTPISGFDWTDAVPIRGDSVAHVARWKGNLSQIQDKPVRIDFSLRNGEFYGFELSK